MRGKRKRKFNNKMTGRIIPTPKGRVMARGNWHCHCGEWDYDQDFYEQENTEWVICDTGNYVSEDSGISCNAMDGQYACHEYCGSHPMNSSVSLACGGGWCEVPGSSDDDWYMTGLGGGLALFDCIIGVTCGACCLGWGQCLNLSYSDQNACEDPARLGNPTFHPGHGCNPDANCVGNESCSGCNANGTGCPGGGNGQGVCSQYCRDNCLIEPSLGMDCAGGVFDECGYCLGYGSPCCTGGGSYTYIQNGSQISCDGATGACCNFLQNVEAGVYGTQNWSYVDGYISTWNPPDCFGVSLNNGNYSGGCGRGSQLGGKLQRGGRTRLASRGRGGRTRPQRKHSKGGNVKLLRGKKLPVKNKMEAGGYTECRMEQSKFDCLKKTKCEWDYDDGSCY